MKKRTIFANLLFTAFSVFAIWCVVTEDPAKVVELVSARPWMFKAFVVYIIVDVVAMIWFLDRAKTVVFAKIRRMRKTGGADVPRQKKI